jgi:hypothetical protein
LIIISSIDISYNRHIACPQQLPINGVVNHNNLQKTTKVKALVIVLRLLPSSFTYAMVTPKVSAISNKLIVT